MSERHRNSNSEPTVLILEDEQGLADLYDAWLSHDYRVRTANTASEARKAFDDTVEIALIDRQLPDESGDDVLRWIRRRNPECRTAMVTAVTPDFDVVEMPLDEYLVKPIDKDELLEIVDLLDRQRQYDDAVRELYGLIAKKTQLESKKSRGELDQSQE